MTTDMLIRCRPAGQDRERRYRISYQETGHCAATANAHSLTGLAQIAITDQKVASLNNEELCVQKGYNSGLSKLFGLVMRAATLSLQAGGCKIWADGTSASLACPRVQRSQNPMN